MKIKVLFHSFGNGNHCNDGFGAALVFWQRFGGGVECIPCVHGEAPPHIEAGDRVFLLDFSYPRNVLLEWSKIADVTVLDHHKTAQADLEGLPFATFDMEKSGAQLAWEYFHFERPAPDLIRYVADRDLWKKELPYSDEINLALNAFPQGFFVWDGLSKRSDYIDFMRGIGKPLLNQFHRRIEELISTAVIRQIRIDGMLYYAYVTNTDDHEIVSDALNTLLKRFKSPGEFALNYSKTEDGKLKFELRSVGEFDVSKIAKYFGGGGHKNAAGFTLPAADKDQCSQFLI